MANDIIRIDPLQPINVEYAVCSAMPTGKRSSLLKFGYYSQNLTIENIESKYDDRFDDISYYTLGNSTLVGG